MACKGALASVKYDKIANIDSTVVTMRNAFDKEIIGWYNEAYGIVQAEKYRNIELDDNAKGFLCN